MSHMQSYKFVSVILSVLVLSLTSACSVGHKITHTPRTAIEQLLLTEATERSLSHPDFAPLPIPPESAVTLVVDGLTKDSDVLKRIVTGWLREQGYVVRGSQENATYRLEIMTKAFGTEFAQTFFGMPAFQSVLIPFALPELALYKAQYETGYARYYMDIVDIATDRSMGPTPIYTGETYYNDYTIFFLFRFSSSNLTEEPTVGMYHGTVESGHEHPFHTTDTGQDAKGL